MPNGNAVGIAQILQPLVNLELAQAEVFAAPLRAAGAQPPVALPGPAQIASQSLGGGQIPAIPGLAAILSAFRIPGLPGVPGRATARAQTPASTTSAPPTGPGALRGI